MKRLIALLTVLSLFGCVSNTRFQELKQRVKIVEGSAAAAPRYLPIRRKRKKPIAATSQVNKDTKRLEQVLKNQKGIKRIFEKLAKKVQKNEKKIAGIKKVQTGIISRLAKAEDRIHQTHPDLYLRYVGPFAADKFDLPTGLRLQVEEIIGAIKGGNLKLVAVYGRSSKTGSRQRNKVLSKSRAEAVAEYFKKQGVDTSTALVEGLGETGKYGALASNQIAIVILKKATP